jgi:hypothetical protein
MPAEWNARRLSVKIAQFCRKRLTSVLDGETVLIETYLLGLIAHREYPPKRGRGIDWRSIAESCGIAHLRLIEVKEEVPPALDAIVRALNSAAQKKLETRVSGDVGRGRARSPISTSRSSRFSRAHPGHPSDATPAQAVIPGGKGRAAWSRCHPASSRRQLARMIRRRFASG